VNRHLLSLGAVAALALSSVVGCSTANTTSGELNQGGFSYSTVGDGRSDIASRTITNDYGGNNPVPVLAVGGAFKVRFIPKDGNGNEWGSDQIIPAAPSLIARDGANLVTKRPGQSAILANDGQVVQDFIHVQVKLVDHVQLSRVDVGFETVLGENDQVNLVAGQPTVELVAQPMSSVGEILAGSMPYQWSVDGDPEVVALTSKGGYSNGLSAGTKPGTAVVSVRVADRSASFHVEVK
jgi:hypothetical protein